jgi:hypothetical protein
MQIDIQPTQKLKRESLYSLEQYAEIRDDYRAQIIAHKKHRQVQIGPNARLYFEDALTMQYQVQEMLRSERLFEAEGIEEELATYNPLIPDGSNWKATFMVEFAEENDRRAALARMIGIEDKVWVQVDGYERVYAIADEDLEREDTEKTSSVHFLRFELAPEMTHAVKTGASIAAGIDHDAYRHRLDALAADVRDSLASDLTG